MPNLSYFYSHPPRCISAFTTTPLPSGLPEAVFDGHGEEWNPVFALSCPCGAQEFRVRGYSVDEAGEDPLFLSPLEANCTGCGQTTPLLDTDVHGYDAELSHGSCTRRAEGAVADYRCPGCSADRGALFMRFEFTQDLFDGSFDNVQVRKEDLFTWVTCISKCSACYDQNTVADFECA